MSETYTFENIVCVVAPLSAKVEEEICDVNFGLGQIEIKNAVSGGYCNWHCDVGALAGQCQRPEGQESNSMGKHDG